MLIHDKKCAIAFVLFCGLLLATSVLAESERYFKADVPVKSQNRQERVSAAELGILDVLVRLSGSENVRFDDALLGATSQAINFVEQFQYAEVEDAELIAQGYKNILQLSFSPRVLRSMLRDSDHKFWPINRPATLVWLVEDHAEFGKQFVQGGADEAAIVSGLQMSAAYRGLPLSFPLLDFQDQTVLSAEQLWALDEEVILQASQRYSADVILVGKYTSTSSGQTWSNWQFFHAGQNRLYDRRGPDARRVGEAAIHPLANFLANMYAIELTNEDKNLIAMQVKNVRSFADYKNLMTLLDAEDSIVEIKLDEVTRDVLSLRLRSEANIEQLISMLALRDSLSAVVEVDQSIPAWQRAAPGSHANPLIYLWRP